MRKLMGAIAAVVMCGALCLALSAIAPHEALAATDDAAGSLQASSQGDALSVQASKCTIVYKANKGTGSMAKQTTTVGKSVKVAKNKFKRAGYTFVCWNTSKDGSGKRYEEGEKATDLSKRGSKVVLYAQWVSSKNVFKVSKKQVKAGKCLTFSGSPSSSGFSDGRYSMYKFSSFQNFSFTPDNKYVFANSIAQRKGTYSTGLILFSVKGKTATFIDGTVLANYGHSEVLAVSQPDSKAATYNVWLAKSTTAKAKSKEDTYGKVIVRLTVTVNEKTGKAKFGTPISISNFVEANVVTKGGKKAAAKFEYGVPERVAVATNQADNRLAFRLKFETGWGMNYVVYDLNKLSADMDSVAAKGSKTYDIKRAKDFQVSNVKCNLVPLGGFQSFDVDKGYLYLAGHTTQKVTYNACIFKISYKASSGELDRRSTKYIAQDVLIQSPEEFEGVKAVRAGAKTSYYFNTIMEKGGQLRYDQMVYKITR